MGTDSSCRTGTSSPGRAILGSSARVTVVVRTDDLKSSFEVPTTEAW